MRERRGGKERDEGRMETNEESPETIERRREGRSREEREERGRR